jgi:D-alanyl-lipoteichoic acid acyltransferase DltB (MBOAT superfamily)
VLFNSLEYAVFFAICFTLYVALPHRAQNRMLLVASYVFYGAWDWRFLLLIAFSTVIDFLVARRLAVTTGSASRRALVTVSVAVNLTILGFFKYAGFFARELSRLVGLFGVTLPPFVLHVVLPVGVSFYTFQALGYTIDVYRRDVEPARNLLDFALFVAFFPQLVAGPIERAGHLLPQILRPRRFSWAGIGSGAWLILSGLFKKVVVADNVAALVNAAYAPGSLPKSGEVLLATYAFALQIYCDFSGYTDIARGSARILGFDLVLNFSLPYLAASPREFWRRWHISLSTWLRDYLYVPLGGNRGGTLRTYRNLLVTMLLGGLWHGARSTFVLWGGYHGLLLVADRAVRPLVTRHAPSGPFQARVMRVVAVVVTFHLVCLGWVLFRAESVEQVARLLGALLGPPTLGLALHWLFPLLVLTSPLILVEGAQALSGNLDVVFRWPLPARAALYAGVFLVIVILGEDFGQPFIYFQF